MMPFWIVLIFFTLNTPALAGLAEEIAEHLKKQGHDMQVSSSGPLFKVRSLKCQFSKGVAAEWKDSELTVHLDSEGPPGEIYFDDISITADSARFIGTSGSSDEKLISTPSGLTFIETTSNDNIVVTTVFHQSMKDGGYFAVMSRHMDFPGGPHPSQNYGSCHARE